MRIGKGYSLSFVLALVLVFNGIKFSYSNTVLRVPVDAATIETRFNSLRVNKIMEEIETGKHKPIYDYMLRLELLHALGILKGILLYPCMGNDYLTSYLTMSLGLNTKNGLGVTQKDTQHLEDEAIQLGLPEQYKGKQKNWKIFNKNSFDYEAYFPEIKKVGGVDVLFIKGLTLSMEFDKSFPGAEGFASFSGSDQEKIQKFQKKLHDSIKDLIVKISQDMLNDGGLVVIADERDLWLADFIAKELGFLDLLSDPQYRSVSELLSKDVASSVTYLGQYRLFFGKVPIKIFKKPSKSNIFISEAKPIASNDKTELASGENLANLSVDQLKIEAELSINKEEPNWVRFNKIVEELKSRNDVQIMTVAGPEMKNEEIRPDFTVSSPVSKSALVEHLSKIDFEHSNDEILFLMHTLHNIYQHVKEGVALVVKQIKTLETGGTYSEVSVIDNGPGFIDVEGDKVSIERATTTHESPGKGGSEGLGLPAAISAVDFSVIHIPGSSETQGTSWKSSNKKPSGITIIGYFFIELTDNVEDARTIKNEVVEKANQYVGYLDEFFQSSITNKLPSESVTTGT